MTGSLLAPESTAVVVVAGLPGAGKTTLVAAEPRALDSDRLRLAWAPRLALIPYALWRPAVHARHWIAIWRALKRPEGVIVARPFTLGCVRRALLRRARRHHPEVHLVIVDATPAQARAGQLARGRIIRERAMRRHERRWSRAHFQSEPWTTVTWMQRSATAPPLNRTGPLAPRRRAASSTEAGRSSASSASPASTPDLLIGCGPSMSVRGRPAST